jgi:hypothetical protein
MKKFFVIVGFINHIALSFIAVDIVGSFLLDSVSVLSTMWCGFLIFGIIITIIYHIKYIMKNKL